MQKSEKDSTMFGAGVWALVPGESALEIRVEDGRGGRTGRIAGPTGLIRIDGDDVTRSRFEFAVPTTGIEIDPAEPGSAALAVEVTDGSALAGIRFQSRVVGRGPGGRLRVLGTLTAGRYAGMMTLSLTATPAGWRAGGRRLRIEAEAIVEVGELSRDARNAAERMGAGTRLLVRLEGTCVRAANVLSFERPLRSTLATV